ncbi:MAG TPA: histidine phosphatase family protein [Rubrivivax sp.]|nr:histidine phosphatase family protein [Rubrivivax sp.]
MRLTLVRHGRPDEGNAARPHDPPLRADGQRQAEAVARLLADEGVTSIVASPLLRAHETALPLAGRLGLPIRTVEGWAEADRHVAHYRSTETLRALGDAEWQLFLDDPVLYLGGDPQVFRGTVLDALLAAAEGDEKAHVAVFTHGLPINVTLACVLGLEKIVHFRPGYGSVTRLLARAGRFGVVSVNESAHFRLS